MSKRKTCHVYYILALSTLTLIALVGWGLYLYTSGQRSAQPSGPVNPFTGQPINAATIAEGMEETRETKALFECISLSSHMEMYKLRFDRYPHTLKELTEPRTGGRPPSSGEEWKPVQGDLLTDPWGKPYQIDMTGKRSDGKAAYVFTTSPSGKVIGHFTP